MHSGGDWICDSILRELFETKILSSDLKEGRADERLLRLHAYEMHILAVSRARTFCLCSRVATYYYAVVGYYCCLILAASMTWLNWDCGKELEGFAPTFTSPSTLFILVNNDNEWALGYVLVSVAWALVAALVPECKGDSVAATGLTGNNELDSLAS